MGKTRTNTAGDDLRRELQDAALALRCAYDRFNHVTAPELVEASIYEINSLQARYNYLLRRAKAVYGGTPVETPRAHPAARAQPSAACVAAAAMEGGRSCPS